MENMIERYTTMGDSIYDKELMTFMDLEESCQKLNEYERDKGIVADFFQDFARRLDEVESDDYDEV